jgi:hypothetical protein
MDIRTFLARTRSNRNDLSGFRAAYHRQFAEVARPFAGAGLPVPELELTSSWQRSCEIVELNGRTYLVYDQYLGQTLNTLNRIFVNSTDREDAEIYGLKVVGEYVLLKGRPDLAAGLLAAHSKMREQHQSYRVEQNLYVRQVFTAVQEAFVMMHELMHHYMALHRSEGIIRAAREFLVDVVETSQDLDQAVVVEEYLRDEYAVLESWGAPPPPERGTPEFERLVEEFWHDHHESKRREIETIRQRDDLVEEFICDTQAAEMTFLTMRERGIPQRLILDAVFVGLMHLRTIARLERYALSLVSESEEKGSMGSFFQGSLTRVSAFRSHFKVVLDTPRRGRIRNALHKRFVQANLHHSAMIMDPVLFGLNQRIEGYKHFARTLPVPEIGESIRLRRQLEELIYFKGAPGAGGQTA